MTDGLNVNELYMFNGPFITVNDLKAHSGIYLISILSDDGSHYVIDIGESHDVLDRVDKHDRKDQWIKASNGKLLHVSSYYCDEPTRMNIESELRNVFNPVCGER